MPHSQQQVCEPKITGHVSEYEIFNGLMALQGADQYIKPTAQIPESDRFELHTILAASCLCGVLRSKRHWKAAFAIGVEFVDGKQDFLEVGEAKHIDGPCTWAAFDEFVKAKALERFWRRHLDSICILASVTAGKYRPWRSMVVIYAGRFGEGPRATATNVIYPHKKNSALPILQNQLDGLGINVSLKETGLAS